MQIHKIECKSHTGSSESVGTEALFLEGLLMARRGGAPCPQGVLRHRPKVSVLSQPGITCCVPKGPVMLDGRTCLGGMILTKTEAEWQMPVRRKTPESGGIKVRAVKRPPASGTCYEDEGRNSLRCSQTSVSTQGGSEFSSDSSGRTVL